MTYSIVARDTITKAVSEEPRWTETLRRLVTVDRVPAGVARAIEQRLNL